MTVVKEIQFDGYFSKIRGLKEAARSSMVSIDLIKLLIVNRYTVPEILVKKEPTT